MATRYFKLYKALVLDHIRIDGFLLYLHITERYVMKKYRVRLLPKEQIDLKKLVASGKYKNTKFKRAQILLGSDESEYGKKMTDE